MPYSNKKLTVAEQKKIANALLACDCISMSDRRFQVLYTLRQTYPSINLKDNIDPNSIGLELVRLCQNHDHAFEKLIEIMDTFYEYGSNPMKSLKENITKVFSPPPPEQASLRIEANGEFKIVTSEKREIIILPRFADLDEINITMVKVYTWKRLHTCSEQLLNSFMEIYEYVVNVDKVDNLQELRESLERFRNYSCNSFVKDLKKLNNPNIFSLPQIAVLRSIPECIDAILETMQEPLSYKYLERGQKLARRIRQILFEALRIADRVLENHLSQDQ